MPLSKLAICLKAGGIAVIPTDTLYGVVASALNKKAVTRLYHLRRNTHGKPFIVLIQSVGELGKFGIVPTSLETIFLKSVWPGKVSVIFPCKRKDLTYLHLGTETLAFRLPNSRKLRELLKKTGPLLVPSANLEGEPTAITTAEAKKYFGDRVDVYVSGGRMKGKPSTLVSLIGSKPKVLRDGAVKISL